MAQTHSIRLVFGYWPAKSPTFQPFGAAPEAAAVPVQNLEPVPSGVREQKQMPAPDFQSESVAHDSVEAIEALAEVGGSQSHINPGGRPESKHQSRILPVPRPPDAARTSSDTNL